MGNFINKYTDMSAYEADSGKQYPNVSLLANTQEIVYERSGEIDYSTQYFTIKAVSGTTNVGWWQPESGGGDDPEMMEDPEMGGMGLEPLTISASTDGGQTWTAYQSSNESTLIATLNVGEKVIIKATNSSYNSYMGQETYHFLYTNKVALEGNIMSLLYGDNFQGQTSLADYSNPFDYFFSNGNIVSAENLVLPATTLGMGCYSNMFYSCTSLTTAPQLPATTLAEGCYSSMFYGCTSLTAAPTLPATTLANYCYQEMFRGCTSLTTAPQLPATTLTDSCYIMMFSGCTSLTTAPALPATTLTSQCYSAMFERCTSLTAAPTLPATTLVGNCYSYMFRNCTSLNSITCLATSISASNCTLDWVSGVASSGTFTKAASMQGWSTGTSGIPSGWDVEDYQS